MKIRAAHLTIVCIACSPNVQDANVNGGEVLIEVTSPGQVMSPIEKFEAERDDRLAWAETTAELARAARDELRATLKSDKTVTKKAVETPQLELELRVPAFTPYLGKSLPAVPDAGSEECGEAPTGSGGPVACAPRR